MGCCWVIESNGQDSDQVLCNRAWKIVVLGSSSAYGTGASIEDSSWVSKFKAYVKRKNINSQVSNFGIPGFRTYQNLRPTGYVPPANRPLPSTTFNISSALAMQPDAIIINMPSNDASSNYTKVEQQANFEAVMQIANSANIPVWVTTTQPRNNFTIEQVNNLTTMRDWIITRFGSKSVNFWDGVANADGTINSVFFYDNAHVNNGGHDLFFRRLQQECILDSLCNRFLGVLSVNAGADQQLPGGTSMTTIQGNASSSNATISSVLWSLISGPNTPIIVNPSQLTISVSGLVNGTYRFELNVSDSKGNIKRDTIQLLVGCQSNFSINQLVCFSQLPVHWNGMRLDSSGIYSKLLTTATGCDSLVTINLSVIACGQTGFAIRTKLEQYVQSNGRMTPYLYEQEMSGDTTSVDTIQVCLWKPANLHHPNPDYEQKVVINRDGYGYASFASALQGQSLFISIRHRNSLEIWSSTPKLMDSINTHDFCSPGATFQNGTLPQRLMNNGEYAMYTGDVNQDGAVDLFDLQLIENGASSFLYGYFSQDCTGDGVVDFFDLQRAENCAVEYLFSSKP